MNETKQKRIAPVMMSWRLLYAALMPLHMNVKADVDRLHDIYMRGAPTPDSIIRNPKGFDPRLVQPGNNEKRIVFFGLLSQWVVDITARRGQPMTAERAMEMLRKVARLAGE